MSTDTTTDNRKSLMLSEETYAKLSAVAKKAGVARPAVLEAMMMLVDEQRLLGKLAEIRAKAAAEAADERKKREALGSLAGELSLAQIEALVKQVTGKSM